MLNKSIVKEEGVLRNEPGDNPLYMFNEHCKWISNQVKSYLLGRVLTIIDACIFDKTQNKAVKDLIQQAVWDKEYFSEEYADIISQFVKKYCGEMGHYLKDIESGIPSHPTRTYFGEPMNRVDKGESVRQ